MNLRAIICAVLVLWLANISANAQIYTNTDTDPQLLVERILLDRFGGIETANVQYDGPKEAFGYFSIKDDFLGFQKGLIISTGKIADCKGPNNKSGSGSSNLYPGFDEVPNLSSGEMHDAAILKFDFIPTSNEVAFEYVFASEEYPEYVNRGVNDVFALYIKGPGINGYKNLATVPGSHKTVCVNNINAKLNAKYYRSNLELSHTNSSLVSQLMQFDGYTVPLTAKSKVQAYKAYQLLIVISDVGDDLYDSAIFLKSNSLRSNRPKLDINYQQLAAVTQTLDSLGASLSFNSDSSVVHFHLNINYAFNSSDIREIYYPVIDNIYKILEENYALNVNVIGHTDNVGYSQYNNQLSEERAKNVAYYLISKGIKINRINFDGKGSQMPIASNKTDEGRAKNRRVEFIFKAR